MAEDVLTNTLVSPSEFDALNKLRENEPYFLLLGRDRIAPGLVAEWADRNRRKALAEFEEHLIDRDKLQHELRQSTDAEMIACSMRSYKAGYDADLATGQGQLSYTGHELPEETAQRDRVQSAKVHAIRAITNAVGELTELQSMLDDDDLLRSCVTALIEDLNGLANRIRPPRPGMK